MRQGAKEKAYPEFPGQFGDGYASCLRPSSKRNVQQEGPQKSKRCSSRCSPVGWLDCRQSKAGHTCCSDLTPLAAGHDKLGNGL